MSKKPYQRPEVFRAFNNLNTMIFRPEVGGDLSMNVLSEARDALRAEMATRIEIYAFGTRWVWPKMVKKTKKAKVAA